jgi:hypothetical protein
MESSDFDFVFLHDGFDLGPSAAGKVAGQPAARREFTGDRNDTRLYPRFAARALE